MQIWKIMFCELLIFTITISRYGYSTCMYTIFKFAKYCKILISYTNNDQIPYFCLTLSGIIYKMHEGEIDSPHKDPLYHIFTSQPSSVFYLLVFTICLWGEQADRKHFDLGRCSIHNADIYIVYSPFGDSENRGFFLFIKNRI